MARELRPLVLGRVRGGRGRPGGGAPRWCRVGGRPARRDARRSSSGCRPWRRCASRPSCSSRRRCSARSGSGSASRSWSPCATCPASTASAGICCSPSSWASGPPTSPPSTIGRLFGRRLLAAEISPAKTVEGFVAGLAAGTATVFFTLYREPHGLPLSTLHALEFGHRDRARRADRRPARELPQARHGREGHREPPRRARRHARPRRRAAAGGAGGLLPGARHRQGMKHWRQAPVFPPGPTGRLNVHDRAATFDRLAAPAVPPRREAELADERMQAAVAAVCARHPRLAELAGGVVRAAAPGRQQRPLPRDRLSSPTRTPASRTAEAFVVDVVAGHVMRELPLERRRDLPFDISALA